MEWTVSKRSGKIFLDHNQNVRTKNMASIYSLRPAPHAPVSTPCGGRSWTGSTPRTSRSERCRSGSAKWETCGPGYWQPSTTCGGS